MNTHPTTPQILSVEKIWDRGPHNAFTDLVRFADRWWCTFREAQDHGPSIGTIRVICSDDGHSYESAAVLAEQDIDLRDPKLSIASDGRLMLVAGGSLYAGTEYGTRSPRIAFSDDGYTWTTPQKVLAEDHWLWRVTWHEGIAYSVSKLGEGSHPRRGFLYSSTDGLDWQWITEFFPAQRHLDGQRDHAALYAGRHHDCLGAAPTGSALAKLRTRTGSGPKSTIQWGGLILSAGPMARCGPVPAGGIPTAARPRS